MAGRVRHEQRGEASVVVKTAPLGPAADALRHEHDVLGQLGHPGVVRAVGWCEDGSTVELATTQAGDYSLADAALGWPRAVRIAAATAAIVSDLHRHGITHGRLTADHVIVGDDGRPVLCSLARSTPVTPASAAADVTQLGETFSSVVGRIEPSSRDRRARRQLQQWQEVIAAMIDGTVDAGGAARMLASIGTAAESPDAVAGSPSVSGIRTAISITAAAEGTRSWRDRVPGAGDVQLRSARSIGLPVALVVVSLVVGVLGASVLRGDEGGGAVRPGDANAGIRVGQLVAAGETETRLVSGPAAPRWCDRVAPVACYAVCHHGVDVTGDGCADDVEQHGNTIRVADQWFVAGDGEDVVVLGDWDCAGGATVALLRPATGEVFVFDTWDAAEPIEALPTMRVAGALDLQVERSGACDRLLVSVGPDRLVPVRGFA